MLEKLMFSKATIEEMCGKKISDADFNKLASLCKRYSLDPLSGEVWIMPGNPSRIMIGKDGYFKIADSNPDFDGLEDGVVVIDKDNNVHHIPGTLVPPGMKLIGGWAKAYSKKKTHPKYSEVSLAEYQGNEKSLWGSKPATMINKVAKCQALRDLFPSAFSGTYDESEINDMKGEKPNVGLISQKQIQVIKELVPEEKMPNLLKHFGKTSLEELTSEEAQWAIAQKMKAKA